jgi:hypothetical protein
MVAAGSRSTRARLVASGFVVLLSSAVLVPEAIVSGMGAVGQYRLTHGAAGVLGTVTVTGCRTTSGFRGSQSATCWGDFTPAGGGDALRVRRLAGGWSLRPGTRKPAAIEPAHPERVWVAGSRVWLTPVMGSALAALAWLAVLAIVLAAPGLARRRGARRAARRS